MHKFFPSVNKVAKFLLFFYTRVSYLFIIAAQIIMFEIFKIYYTIRLKSWGIEILACVKDSIFFILIYFTILHTPVCQATICWFINLYDFRLSIYGSIYPSNSWTSSSPPSIYPSIHLRKVIMQGKLFQRCTYLLYYSVLSLEDRCRNLTWDPSFTQKINELFWS